jgi:aryl-alcohol dehydrogenase-like predicted oxidoreductase
LELTAIGVGTWAIGGGGWSFAWGKQDDDASVAAIHCALDHGVNWIDTAFVYGLGHAEEVVGRAVKGMSERPIIATKCGRLGHPDGTVYKCIKADSVRRECENSLRRLGVDEIDLYQIHWPEPDEEIEEAWGCLQELLKEGKIRYAAVSNFSVEQLERIAPIGAVTSLQPPYSMLKRDIESSQIPYCRENNIGILAYSPMQKGLLTGTMTPERMANLDPEDHRRRDPMFNEPQLPVHLRFVERLSKLAEAAGRTPAQLALAWTLRDETVTSAITGMRNAVQTRETCAAGDWVLEAALVDEIASALAEHAAELAEK